MSDAARPRILIIDDDEELNALLREYLSKYGLAVTTASHPDRGLALLRADPPDLLVLDVMLPGQDGFAVCQKVRAQSPLPIIMLTARGDVADRVVGLELGADDYLPKPFDPRELVARIHAVLRRGVETCATEVLRAGDLTVDAAARTAVLTGATLALTNAELEVLMLLMRNRGRVLTRDRILDATRGLEWDAVDRSIDVTISRLRHKLGDDPKAPTFIKTVWGQGYVFIGGDHD